MRKVIISFYPMTSFVIAVNSAFFLSKSMTSFQTRPRTPNDVILFYFSTDFLILSVFTIILSRGSSRLVRQSLRLGTLRRDTHHTRSVWSGRDKFLKNGQKYCCWKTTGERQQKV